MTNEHDSNPDPLGPDGGVPYEQESAEAETPRRAASAQFVVDAAVGTEAAMREAMDPANQSLADALRLSFKVLQIVILVLIVLFIFSGWKSVKSNQTGVLTVWGKIIEHDGSEALTPGLKFSKWPYPAGEFILFEEANREVELAERTFFPHLGQRSFDDAVANASVNDLLRPYRDGSLITRDGELAHLKLNARYAIRDPGRFVRNVRLDVRDDDRIVQLSLQRSAVHAVAALSVEEVSDRSEVLAAELQRSAQQFLDEVDCGIMLQAVNLPRATAPLAIRNTMAEFQQAGVEVQETLERARQQYNETLTSVAGGSHQDLVALIREYQQLVELDRVEASESKLAEINAMLESPEIAGEVAQVIQSARNYESEVESSLGNEARRFASMLPTYREQPNMVIRRLWFETYARVLSRPDAEIIYAPADLATVKLQLNGLEDIATLRQKARLQRKQAETYGGFATPLGIRRIGAENIVTDGPGRQLQVDPETGRVKTGGGSTRPRSSGGGS